MSVSVILGSLYFSAVCRAKRRKRQGDVLAALAQWRHLDGDGVEAIVEVFAELAFADGLAHVDIGGGHDAHVGLHDFLTAHADIFARLEHTQQSCLGGYGQLAHLVQEDGAAVGGAEIAFALAYGAGKRPLLMSEELAVYRSLGDGATVDGKVFLLASGGVVVDDAGYNLLTHTAFAHDEYRQVGWGYLQGDVECTVEPVAVADNIIPLLYLLQFRSVHWSTKLLILFNIMVVFAVFFIAGIQKLMPALAVVVSRV